MAWTQGPYAIVNDTEVDAESPVTQSLMFRLRDNAFAGMQGDPNAIADDRGVWVDKNGQSAIQTDELDVNKVLKPDGAGGVAFSSIAPASLPSNYGSNGVTVSTTGTWFVNAVASRRDFGNNIVAPYAVGQCVVVNGVIVSQSTFYVNANSGLALDWFDMFNPTTVRWRPYGSGTTNMVGTYTSLKVA